MARPVVLLVEADAAVRERIGSRLERAGFDVMQCPGPREPDYSCVGGRGGPCPLAAAADAVVLDLDLEASTEMVGTAGEDLLTYYLTEEKPVVAITHDPDATRHLPDERIVALRWPQDEGELEGSVRKLLLPRPSTLGKARNPGEPRAGS